MSLSERQKKILKVVIRSYLDTGEPIGSKAVSQEEGLEVSPATIRNEMAALEEQGYLTHPHTSAGRVPTDCGYRFYVNELMEEKTKAILDMTDLFSSKMDQAEKLIRLMGKRLARLTNYATMISGPRYINNEIKMVQLSRIDAANLIVVVVVEGNTARNHIIEVSQRVSDSDLLKLNIFLNSALQGKTVDDLTILDMRRLKAQAGEYGEITVQIMEAIVNIMESITDENPDVYTYGATNLFRYPELSDKTMATEFLKDFEDEDLLGNFLQTQLMGEHDIQVFIGDETPLNGMKNCSVVTASYELGKGVKGTIGIVGPKRMNYEEVIGMLKHLVNDLDQAYRGDKPNP